MIIGSSTNNISSYKTGTAAGENSSSSSPLQKMLKQLQDQLKKVNESDAPEDVKAEQIKELQEKISKLQEQIAKEKLEKSSEKKAEKTEKEDPTSEKLREKGFTVTDADLTRGIVSSSNSMELAATAHTQYVAAKARKDESGMARALGYQVENTAKAQKEIEAIKVEALKKARETEKNKANEHGDVDTVKGGDGSEIADTQAATQSEAMAPASAAPSAEIVDETATAAPSVSSVQNSANSTGTNKAMEYDAQGNKVLNNQEEPFFEARI